MLVSWAGGLFIFYPPASRIHLCRYRLSQTVAFAMYELFVIRRAVAQHLV
jgi:hypothetical protein